MEGSAPEHQAIIRQIKGQEAAVAARIAAARVAAGDRFAAREKEIEAAVFQAAEEGRLAGEASLAAAKAEAEAEAAALLENARQTADRLRKRSRPAFQAAVDAVCRAVLGEDEPRKENGR